MAAHVSQSQALASAYQRLHLRSGRERLRWLIRPAGSRKVPRPRVPRQQYTRNERTAGQAG
jgi:hypothetical protein